MQYAGRGLAGQQVKATLQWLQLTLQKHNSLCPQHQHNQAAAAAAATAAAATASFHPST
jgi:hypothetical protein